MRGEEKDARAREREKKLINSNHPGSDPAKDRSARLLRALPASAVIRHSLRPAKSPSESRITCVRNGDRGISRARIFRWLSGYTQDECVYGFSSRARARSRRLDLPRARNEIVVATTTTTTTANGDENIPLLGNTRKSKKKRKKERKKKREREAHSGEGRDNDE